ncbi:MAG: hypothetical protein CSA65_01110 [Proteobacteria bacterium]|nr:MAG: hypothetical protein CSA65_01110 [Pseudomonadota bacterium]
MNSKEAMKSSSCSPPGKVQPSPLTPQKPKTSTLAIVALVFSLLFFIPFFPLIGAILGIVALVRVSSRLHLSGKGLAIAAIPVGFFVFVVFQATMAAIAIPAFTRYLRKAKSVEATEGLGKIRLGAKSFTQVEHVDKTKALLTAGFPVGDTGWTPSERCCASGTPTCTSAATSWNTPLWRALKFQISGPHYYQFRYTGTASSFVAEARGDLDCDGVFSSYTIRGTRNADGSVWITGPVIRNELE